MHGVATMDSGNAAGPERSRPHGDGRADQVPPPPERRPTESGAPDPSAGGRPAAERLGIDVAMLELLVCPIGGSALTLDAENGVLISRRARLAFPIRDGIPILETGEATPLDEHDPRLHPRARPSAHPRRR